MHIDEERERSMDWKNRDGKLVAETDYGRYEIEKSPDKSTLSVTLDSGDDIHHIGTAWPLSDAQKLASDDLTFRAKMWETL